MVGVKRQITTNLRCRSTAPYFYQIQKYGAYLYKLAPNFNECRSYEASKKFYGPEWYLMYLTDRCWFLNCSVMMSGGGWWRDSLWIQKVFQGGGRRGGRGPLWIHNGPIWNWNRVIMKSMKRQIFYRKCLWIIYFFQNFNFSNLTSFQRDPHMDSQVGIRVRARVL